MAHLARVKFTLMLAQLKQRRRSAVFTWLERAPKPLNQPISSAGPLFLSSQRLAGMQPTLELQFIIAGSFALPNRAHYLSSQFEC